MPRKKWGFKETLPKQIWYLLKEKVVANRQARGESVCTYRQEREADEDEVTGRRRRQIERDWTSTKFSSLFGHSMFCYLASKVLPFFWERKEPMNMLTRESLREKKKFYFRSQNLGLFLFWHFRVCLAAFSNTNLYILNSITHIFTYFLLLFIHTYIKNTQTNLPNKS